MILHVNSKVTVTLKYHKFKSFDVQVIFQCLFFFPFLTIHCSLFLIIAPSFIFLFFVAVFQMSQCFLFSREENTQREVRLILPTLSLVSLLSVYLKKYLSEIHLEQLCQFMRFVKKKTKKKLALVL